MVIDASSRVCFRSAFGRPPAPVIPGLLIRRSPPRLLTAAARTGLGPAPESRSRWACHHLPRSCKSRLFVHFENSFPCLCGTRPHAHSRKNSNSRQRCSQHDIRRTERSRIQLTSRSPWSRGWGPLTCHQTFIQRRLESRFFVRHVARVEQRAIGGAGRGCAAERPLR